MSSTIQVRVDDDLKTRSDKLFKDLGTDTTTAIRIFLTQSLAVNGFPFEIKKIAENPFTSLSEVEMLDKLETARKHAAQEMYKDADDVSRDMRAKYGL
ncbi:MAG: type II toxin-antitoxin system RelB/DinJ family antitoxin [Lachnospiraceae bacterium]|nr:type II toxin-antitoxin system RelB/DinJ family antitoxin [Lachnospiraceae bacterium]